MDAILAILGEDQVALDLGCGGGSFQYGAYGCRIIGIDTAIHSAANHGRADRVLYIEADSNEGIPLSDASVDAVICNHSLEHIACYERVLEEIRRVLKPDGLIWISVPDGFGFDDGLYRFLYSGGGHVNRFTFEGLKHAVETITRRKLISSITLSSGFVYCKPLSPSLLPSASRRLRWMNAFGVLSPVTCMLICSATRFLDRLFQTRTSVYGWGFVFGPNGRTLTHLASPYNVCYGCGCGNAFQNLTAKKPWGLPVYRCPRCSSVNILFKPPARFD